MITFSPLTPTISLPSFQRQFSHTVKAVIQCVEAFFSQLLYWVSFGHLLTAYQRENRTYDSSTLIHHKIMKEVRFAKNAMEQEIDNPHFAVTPNANLPEETHREIFFNGQVGVCDTIGRRNEMEDAHLAVAFDLHIQGHHYPVQLFGVFDGHGGSAFSHYIKDHLQAKLSTKIQGLSDLEIWNALKMTFVEMSQELPNEFARQGSRATVAIILNQKLWVANVGDARTILQNGEETEALTEDAKPLNPRFRKGIEMRGGQVISHFRSPRVNGILAVARAVGDRSVDAISSRPKITQFPLNNIVPGSHLVLACDGIWDVASTKQIGRAIYENREQSAIDLAEMIVSSAYNANSRDNLSVMVIKL